MNCQRSYPTQHNIPLNPHLLQNDISDYRYRVVLPEELNCHCTDRFGRGIKSDWTHARACMHTCACMHARVLWCISGFGVCSFHPRTLKTAETSRNKQKSEKKGAFTFCAKVWYHFRRQMMEAFFDPPDFNGN